MPETPRLILNRTGETPHVLHREDCPSIQHQVRGDVREEQHGGFEVLETYEDGLTLVGPGGGADRTFYRATYVTIEELASAGRYRRCKACAPDAPEGPPPTLVHRKMAETLGASDIGRLTVAGEIERIEHSRTGTLVTLAGGETLSMAAGETVSFPRKRRSEP